jgi:DNA-binding MarR family transcriptional regulator
VSGGDRWSAIDALRIAPDTEIATEVVHLPGARRRRIFRKGVRFIRLAPEDWSNRAIRLSKRAGLVANALACRVGILSDRTVAMPLRALSEVTGIDRADVTRTLRSMEKSGLIVVDRATRPQRVTVNWTAYLDEPLRPVKGRKGAR